MIKVSRGESTLDFSDGPNLITAALSAPAVGEVWRLYARRNYEPGNMVGHWKLRVTPADSRPQNRDLGPATAWNRLLQQPK